MQNYYQFIVPRLNGADIRKDFKKHLSLVRKGIAGFIVFGGRLEQTRSCLKKLQEESETPLIIASDLERGLGQQLKGGTLFPPAMALAQATLKKEPCGRGERARLDRLRNNVSRTKLKLLRESFRAVAEEARYAGINTILAPVLDINTNPDNPIISVRAFGEDSDTVSFFGREMIKTLQAAGIAACGKHFPGHGDTEIDSHISLPSINRSLASLVRNELLPFRTAVEAGVEMLMLGHLKVPAMDPSGLPVSVSEKAVGYIRKKMRYDGILITDAMNMGGLGKYTEEKASFMALSAGADILLHPMDTEKVVSYLRKTNSEFQTSRLNIFRKKLLRASDELPPSFEANSGLSEILTRSAISITEGFQPDKEFLLVVLHDEAKKNSRTFIKTLKASIPRLRTVVLTTESADFDSACRGFETGHPVITAVFSGTRAWKGNTGRRLAGVISSLADRTDLFISFGNPYLLDSVKKVPKMQIYWDSEPAQRIAAEELLKQIRSHRKLFSPAANP